MISSPRKRLVGLFAAPLLGILAGCGYSGPSSAVPAAALQGSVHSGHQPVRGSSIQLYAAGASGNGSSAQGLLSEAVQTDNNGNFSIPAAYGCPGPTSQMFVIAHGGNAGLASGASNSALTLMAALGSCASISRVGTISINEVTTVGSVWPLAPFMKSSTEIGSASGDPAFLAAVSSIPEFINIAEGSSPGTPAAASSFTENSKLYSLSDLLASCVSSAGGSSGDGSPCGQLFTIATPAGEGAPTDTTAAALSIAQHPASNVAAIFNLTTADTAFMPALNNAPTDWTLFLTYPIAVPVISLPTGTYTGSQQVTISDATPNSTLYYTNDGTAPTSASTIYHGPITVSVSTTIAAIALLQGSQSDVASSVLTIAASLPAQTLVFLQPPTNALIGATMTPGVQVGVEDGNGNLVTTAANPVTLALTAGTGLTGTLTTTAQNGVATFNNLSLSNAGNYTLTASSPTLASSTSKTFTISAPNTGNPTTATKVAFLQQPTNAVTGATMSPVTVVVEDSSGHMVGGANNPITLALSSGSGLEGTLTVAAQNGMATFATLQISVAGTYTLLASSPSLTSAVSTNFTIAAPITQPSPVKLMFVQQPSNAVAGATLSPAITVAVLDSSGDTVPSATNTVTLALSSGSGLGGAVTANTQNGVATFSSLSVNTAGTYALSATSAGLTTATSVEFSITASPSSGTTYYLSATGNDSNSGLSASASWLTPNHALTCGDVISAASGAYSSANFNSGKWGAVSCPGGNNVAWLQCAAFDTCKITANTSDGMWVDQSYWGVQGWEITASNSTDGACFHAGPRSTAIHHIIFANDVANGCMGGGFTAYDRSTSASVDYIVYVGNIAYNSAQGSGACFSGFNIYQPIASDNNAGTHMFVAGNFSWGNRDGNPCAGTAPTDGEGINFDTWDFSQGGGAPYTQQGVIENNIEFLNGGDGIEVENNSAGPANASIFIKNNTQYGDRRDSNQTFCTGNGEIDIYKSSNVSATNNLIYSGFATGCQGDAMYAIAVSTSDATNVIDNNFASGVSGNNTFIYASGSFGLGSGNTLGVDPSFAHPADSSAPSCGGSANVTACMATVIADFTPAVSTAKTYGYQQPSLVSVYDPLFPQWLCHVTLPAGLVTMGCQ